jgi:sucrose phosphorylase
VGRDINRPYLSPEVVDTQLQKPVVKGLCKLIELRNSSSAFHGVFSVEGAAGKLSLSWKNASSEAYLELDLAKQQGAITLMEGELSEHYDLALMARGEV